jgi:hypothetical protein
MRARVTPKAIESLVVAACGGFYAAFILRSDFSYGGKTYFSLIDDSMISMVYARNLADGHGLIYQSGEHIEGYTNFLWTLWMAVLHLLPFSEATAGLPVMISSALILIATMLVVRSICRLLVPDRRWVPAAAMALTGLAYPLVFWSLRGMETGLCALLVALSVWFALRLREEVTNRRLAGLAATIAIAVLTRDDMIVPSTFVIAFALWWAGPGLRRRVLLLAGGALVAAIAAHVAFRVAYYGDALPNTYYLKLEGIPLGTRLHRGFVGLTYTVLTGLNMALVLGLAALMAAWRTPRLQALSLLGGIVAVECIYSLYVGGDYAEQLLFANRFIVTALPLLAVLAAVGMSELLRNEMTVGARRATAAFGIVLLATAAVLQGNGWSETDNIGIAGAAPYTTSRVALTVLAAALLAGLAFGLHRRWRAPQPLAAAALLVLTFAATDYAPVRHFAEVGPDDVPLERFDIARAVLLRESSPRDTTAAVVVAGNWGYFSHRRVLDLLGKVDEVVAHGPRRPIVFKPGHVKWNYAYSIGKLRPEVVADLVFPTERDLCNMATWGYRQISTRFWVRAEAQGIDVPRLVGGLSSLDDRPPFPVPAGCAPNA